MNDSRGTAIKVGQKVAYNLSGEVVKGTVKKVNARSVIISTDQWWHGGALHDSTIKNGRGVLVLEENTERSCPNCGQTPV